MTITVVISPALPTMNTDPATFPVEQAAVRRSASARAWMVLGREREGYYQVVCTVSAPCRVLITLTDRLDKRGQADA
ncbi:hypothetical protein [Streptosporangium roseum]|uniref:hypothetical protein n=1 Tax=Streptosporangium roseum TaxID=2001 RepID=UPI003326E98F